MKMALSWDVAEEGLSSPWPGRPWWVLAGAPRRLLLAGPPTASHLQPTGGEQVSGARGLTAYGLLLHRHRLKSISLSRLNRSWKTLGRKAAYKYPFREGCLHPGPLSKPFRGMQASAASSASLQAGALGAAVPGPVLCTNTSSAAPVSRGRDKEMETYAACTHLL